MVAFAACPRSDEFGDSDDDDDDITGDADDVNDGHHHHHHRKDAQRDAERTGYFCVNVVSDGLAWAMNASAAPLGRGLSEFRLAGGGGSPNRADDDGSVHDNERIAPSPLPAPAVDAPFVSQSPSFMECRYVKTGKP
jgi:flavin reductase (DIM6/NTAB) family NADH-FMN oxidoreductase RutF